MHNPEHPARWMADRVESKGQLTRSDAATGVERHFGNEYLEVNAEGDIVVQRRVVAIFRAMTLPDVMWSKHSKAWHLQRSRSA